MHSPADDPAAGDPARGDPTPRGATDAAELTPGRIVVLLASVLIVAVGGIAYELIIAAVGSYLIGNGVMQFSITIGLFMLAMGVGSLASQRIERHLVAWFIAVEIVLAVLGGYSSSILFWAFPGFALYRPVSYALILAIGSLVGLEIPILTRILSGATTWRAAIANVLSLDYFGALIGSVAFPLFLLPTLGLFRSSLGVGLLNALVAVATLVPFTPSLRRTVPKIAAALWAAAMAAVLLLAAGLAGSNWLRDRAESQLFTSNIVLRQQTPYQRVIVTRNERDGRIRLYLNGHLQFAEHDEYRYHESLVHPLLSLPGEIDNVLILGGGDGLAVRECRKFDGIERIDLVDIDPAVTELADRFEPLRRLNGDSLSDPRVTVHHADAFTFLLNRPETEPPFDRVIIDLPDPHDESLSKLYSVEFYRMIRRRLSDDGALVCQSSSPLFTRRTYWCVAETMRRAGFETMSYGVNIPSFGPWGFHLAATRPMTTDDIAIDESRTRYLTDATFLAATNFAADERPVSVAANHLFEPTIYLYYLRDLR